MIGFNQRKSFSSKKHKVVYVLYICIFSQMPDRVTMAVIEDTTWDINAYRQAHESDEHWQLKRDFMEAHKSRIAEERLVCLAQVYQNIELLGCK